MRTVDPVNWPKKASQPVRRASSGQQPHGPSVVEMRLRASYRDAMREYWRHCSIKGLHRVADTRLSKMERCEHGVVFLACVAWGVVVAGGVLQQLQLASPLQVQQHSLLRSIHQVPFPAVAVCSSCVIAKEPLLNYTRILLSKSAHHRNSTYNATSIWRKLLQFGSLLTMELPEVDVAFAQFLARLEPALDVQSLMRNFSIPCDAMLRRCSWRGRELPCHLLFTMRATPLGFCCVFNSRYYDMDTHIRPRFLDMVGQNYGLTVIVYENPEEFAYTRRASIGPDVLLFDGSEYPLIEGGGVRMYPIELNTSVFMSVRAASQRAGAARLAGCERRARSGSHAACLLRCRRRTLASLCSCRPHTLPPHPDYPYPVCSLTDLPCLNKHREKFIYYYPGESRDQALEEELQNGQDCQECSPDCERVLYSAAVSVARLHHLHHHKLFRRKIAEGRPLVNKTVLRLFYSSEHQKLFSVEANIRWYEAFAALSCSWWCMTGVTLAAACEAAFYLTARPARHYTRRARSQHDGRDAGSSVRGRVLPDRAAGGPLHAQSTLPA